MLFDRRAALRGIAGIATPLLLARQAEAQTDFPPHPSPSKFEAGDFLWTGRTDEYIPFDASEPLTAEADAKRWGAARDAFVRHAQQFGDAAVLDAAKRLQGLTYDVRELDFFIVEAHEEEHGGPRILFRATRMN
jgi:hypothetical protein